METFDVAVIGAGSSGASIARRLARYKLDIVVLEREDDVSMGATKANSGIVHGGYAEDSGLLKGRLCVKGRRRFAALQEELNFGFRETGSLVLEFSEDRSGLEELFRNGLRNGLDDLEIVDSARIRELEPKANPEARWALYCRGAGVCSPYEYAIALAENAVANGVQLRLGREVASIAKSGEGFALGCVDRSGGGEREESYSAKCVVNCAGVDAARVCDMTGAGYFGITPRSGEYLILGRGSGESFRTVLFQMPGPMGKGILVTPTYHGNLLLGPDARDETEIDRSTHVERLREIVRLARRTSPDFDVRQVIRSFAGLRAVSSTNDFIIEEARIPGFVNVAGIQSPGLTSSPAIAELVEGTVGRILSLEAKPSFDPYRPPIILRKALMPFREAARLVDLPPCPERLVCRCEQVSEAEIVDALHRGIEVTTVDGVKRRTRAGMGFCQGEFCRPRVVEVMRRELGREIDAADDVEHSGLSRATKKDFADLFAN